MSENVFDVLDALINEHGTAEEMLVAMDLALAMGHPDAAIEVGNDIIKIVSALIAAIEYERDNPSNGV